MTGRFTILNDLACKLKNLISTEMDVKDFEEYVIRNKKSDLIFDLDSTIIRLDLDWALWHPAVAKIYKKYDTFFEYKGEYVHTMVNEFIKKYGSEIRDEIVEFNYRFERDNLKGIEINKELVTYIKNISGVKMYILTNNDSRNTRKYLKELGLENKFEFILGRNDVKYAKPDKEGINRIIKDNNKSSFLMIGDSIDSDKTAADSSSIDFYWIDYFKN